jgi:hypothetical protein
MGVNPEELKIATFTNRRKATQFFESNNLDSNLYKTNYILFQTKQST